MAAPLTSSVIALRAERTARLSARTIGCDSIGALRRATTWLT